MLSRIIFKVFPAVIRTYTPRNIFKDMQARGIRTYPSLGLFSNRRTYLLRYIFSVSPVCCSGTNLRLPRIKFKVFLTSGSRTYQLLSIFKDMQARGRRTYSPRNIFKVVQARSKRTYRSYGTGIRG